MAKKKLATVAEILPVRSACVMTFPPDCEGKIGNRMVNGIAVGGNINRTYDGSRFKWFPAQIISQKGDGKATG